MVTAAAIPKRSLEQRLGALEKANAVRSLRAGLKRDLKAGRVFVLPLLLDPPEWIETMKVYELLLAVPQWGRVKVNMIFRWSKFSASKTVGGLTDRQRRELATELRRMWGASDGS